MKTITVDVTQKHIDRGEPTKPTDCPIAIAASEACPLAQFLVAPTWINIIQAEDTWENGDPDKRQELPATAIRFISDFDCGRQAAPFSFELSVPDWAVAEEPIRSYEAYENSFTYQDPKLKLW